MPAPATALLMTAIMLAVVPRYATPRPSLSAGSSVSGHRPCSGAK